MALTLESQNLSWQRIRLYLDALQSSPAAQGANGTMKAFKSWMTQYKLSAPSNASTQVLFFDDANLTTSGGFAPGGNQNTVPIAAACHVYAIYFKKVGTLTNSPNSAFAGTATAAYIKLTDDAANDATASELRFIAGSFAANDEFIYFYPQGIAMANGVVVNADTTAVGTTDSTAGDTGSGFVLIGG
jgi:hypothetical protein